MFARGNLIRLLVACATLLPAAVAARAQGQRQSFVRYDRFESERSDRLPGGRAERAEFAAGEPDIKLTLNVPSFRLTLWQNGREVKSWNVGVGMKDYPIYIGEREASQVIWNPSWIPPSSDWVRGTRGIRPGEVIKAS